MDISQLVMEAIENAIDSYCDYHKKEGLTTYNGKPAGIYDQIIKIVPSITKDYENIICYKTKITSREMLFIFNKSNNILYSFMSYSRFYAMTRGYKEKQKYTKALVNEYNNDFIAQPQLFEDDSPDINHEEMNAVLQLLFSSLNDAYKENISCYNIIVYGIKNDELFYLKCNILDKNFYVYSTQDWLKDVSANNDKYIEEKDMEGKDNIKKINRNLSLKEKAIKRKNRKTK